MSRRRAGTAAAVIAVCLTGTAVAAHLAADTDGHTTAEQTLVREKEPGTGYSHLKLGPGEPHVVRESPDAKALADRDKRRVSLAYMSQMTDFQLADEESPTRVEFVDPGPSSAWRPQEGFTPFQVEATIRQINRYAEASPIPQGDGTRNAMDMALITGDQADNQHFNETVWVRDLLEGRGGPTNFNSGLSSPADYADPASLGASCDLFVAQAGGAEQAAAEGARYTGVQDYDDYPVGAPVSPLYYDPDEPREQWADWPEYEGLLDRAQQIVIEPEGLKVPFYITNGNHDVLVQGNEDANKAYEEISTGCFKALGTTNDPTSPAPPDGPDPNLLLSPADVGMLIPPDPKRRFVSKVQIKEIYGATDEGPGDDDHGFKYVDPAENEKSRFSASYYAWDPEQTPGFRFISIDTNSEGGQTAESIVPGQPSTPGSSNGNLDDPQFQWLRRELEAAKARNQLVVIFGHHPVRSMNTQVRDEQAAPCTVDDEHGHDVNPGCDLDPRPSDDDPDTPGVGCIHNGTDAQNSTCPQGHESFVDLIDQFPNVTAYIPGHTHEHRLTPFTRTGGSTWWEINTSAVIDFPNQSRLVELMDNRDGTLSIFNTVVDHAAPAAPPPGCSDPGCTAQFTEPELASLGRTFSYNDPDNDMSGTGRTIDRNAELLLGDPRPLADLSVTQADAPDPVAVGRPVTYTVTVTNGGPGESHDTTLVDELRPALAIGQVQSSRGTCSKAPGRVECDLGTLASGATATIRITVTPEEEGEITSTARVRGNVSDRVAANDTATETTTVQAAPAVTTPPEDEGTQTPDPSPTTTDPGTTPGTPAATTPRPPAGAPGQQYPVPRCARASAFTRAAAIPRGRRVEMSFERSAGAGPVTVDVFQTSSGRRVLGERLVARFSGRTSSFVFSGRPNRGRRKLRDGYYFVRFRADDAEGGVDTRRRVLRRAGGRWTARPPFEKLGTCGLFSAAKLERPVFGGTTRRGLRLSYRLRESARVRVEILRGRRVVRRLAERSRRAGATFRIPIDRGLRRRGDYRVRLTARRGGTRDSVVLVSRRL